MPAPGRPSSRRPRRARAAVASMLAVAALAPVVAACDGDSAASASGDEIVVATTVAPITSIVANIGGDRADIAGIVPEGTNSHTFEPKPSVAELLSTADVVFLNGLELEEPTKELAEADLRTATRHRRAGRRRRSPRTSTSTTSRSPRPAASPTRTCGPTRRWRCSYAEIVRDDLSERDPGNADYYAANYDGVRRDGRRARRGDARVVRDHPGRRPQAAHLPRRLRLLRRGLRLGGHRRDPGRRTSRTRRRRRSPA